MSRALRLSVFACACLCAPSPALAYRTLAQTEGSQTPIVWAAPPSIAVDVAGLIEADASLLTEELRASIAIWNAASCRADVASFAGTDPASGAVVVRMVDDWTGSGFDPTAAGVTDLVLVSTAGGIAIVSATLSLNGTMTWGPHPQEPDAARDMRAVLVHELGHALGLEHSDDADATMYALYTGASQADLAPDDVAGLCSLYSEPVPTCDGGCPEGSVCVAGECRGPAAPQCSVDAPCTEGACALAGNNEGSCIPEGSSGAACERGADCVSGLCVSGSGVAYCTVDCSYDDQCAGMQRCAVIEGRSVCAPLAESGCSAGPGEGRAPFSPLLLLAAAVLALRNRRGVRR